MGQGFSKGDSTSSNKNMDNKKISDGSDNNSSSSNNTSRFDVFKTNYRAESLMHTGADTLNQIMKDGVLKRIEDIRETLDHINSNVETQSDINKYFQEVQTKINEDFKKFENNITSYINKSAIRDTTKITSEEHKTINDELPALCTKVELASEFQNRVITFLTELSTINEKCELLKKDQSIAYNKIIGKDEGSPSHTEFQELLKDTGSYFKSFCYNFCYETTQSGWDSNNALQKIDKQILAIQKQKEFADKCCDSYTKYRETRKKTTANLDSLKETLSRDLRHKLTGLQTADDFLKPCGEYFKIYDKIRSATNLKAKSYYLEKATSQLNDLSKIAEKVSEITELVEQVKAKNKLEEFKEMLLAKPSTAIPHDNPSTLPEGHSTLAQSNELREPLPAPTTSGDNPPPYVTLELVSKYMTKKWNWNETVHHQEQLEEMLDKYRDHWQGPWWERPTLLNCVTNEINPENVIRAYELIDTYKENVDTLNKERNAYLIIGIKEFLGHKNFSRSEKNNVLRQDVEDAGLLAGYTTRKYDQAGLPTENVPSELESSIGQVYCAVAKHVDHASDRNLSFYLRSPDPKQAFIQETYDQAASWFNIGKNQENSDENIKLTFYHELYKFERLYGRAMLDENIPTEIKDQIKTNRQKLVGLIEASSNTWRSLW